MTTYRVGMIQTVIEECTVQIVADTAEEAKRIAVNLANKGDPAVDWRFLEASDPVQAVNVYKVEG